MAVHGSPAAKTSSFPSSSTSDPLARLFGLSPVWKKIRRQKTPARLILYAAFSNPGSPPRPNANAHSLYYNTTTRFFLLRRRRFYGLAVIGQPLHLAAVVAGRAK